MFTKRNVGMVVLLTLVTCGLYGIYWLYQTLVELEADLQSNHNPVLDIVLCFITCGIYSLYLSYRIAKDVYTAQMKRGLVADDKSVICLILNVIGLGILSTLIIQCWSGTNCIRRFS